jgi:hypothetical protein
MLAEKGRQAWLPIDRILACHLFENFSLRKWPDLALFCHRRTQEARPGNIRIVFNGEAVAIHAPK